MKRATGIGSIFFKAKDPAKIKQWYAAQLGLNKTQMQRARMFIAE
jgi:catechol-2,3-dioxygenase